MVDGKIFIFNPIQIMSWILKLELKRINSSANIIGIMNKEFKLKMAKYFEKDFSENKREDGRIEIFNSYGGVEEVLSKKKYFSELKSVNSFEDLEGFWDFISGGNAISFGSLIDDILKEKIA
jgi:hypothetical protein